MFNVNLMFILIKMVVYRLFCIATRVSRLSLISFFPLFIIMGVSLASINVNGLAERPKRVKVFEYLRSLHFDLLFLQETHLADTFSGEAWEKDWGGHCAWSPGSNRSAGVAVLVHPNSSVKIADFKTDLAGRIVTAKLEVENREFQVMNVYAPNSHAERESFFDTLWCFTFPNLDNVVLGDFNCVPNIQLDKWGGDDSLHRRTGRHGKPRLAIRPIRPVSN